jgi:transcriptional regulator with XRE-family HTH domain
MTIEDRIQKLRNDVANMFVDMRLDEGWTIQGAARKLGVHFSNLHRLENGGTDLKLSTLQKYAHAYGYQVEIALVPIGEEDDGPVSVPDSGNPAS